MKYFIKFYKDDDYVEINQDLFHTLLRLLKYVPNKDITALRRGIFIDGVNFKVSGDGVFDFKYDRR